MAIESKEIELGSACPPFRLPSVAGSVVDRDDFDGVPVLGVFFSCNHCPYAKAVEGRLIELEDSTEHWIVRRGASPAYVLPHVRELLTVLGERFQQRLAELELPAYRLEVTSATRTSERQADLRDGNANAAAGVSSHEFGATVDVSYAAFAPPAVRPEEIFSELPADLRARFEPHIERLVDLAFESVSARKSREIAAILSRVLEEAQREGIAVVIYERQQTVYHLTVARPIANPPTEGVAGDS